LVPQPVKARPKQQLALQPEQITLQIELKAGHFGTRSLAAPRLAPRIKQIFER
jgi:hypothetical protein